VFARALVFMLAWWCVSSAQALDLTPEQQRMLMQLPLLIFMSSTIPRTQIL